MNPKEMTGLQLLEAMCTGKIPPASISDTIPMQPFEVSEGRISFKAKADHRHLNPLGGVHGGFAATVLDSVTGCASHSVVGAGEGYGTTDLNIKMCRPIPYDTKMIAEGKVINVGRNLIIAEGYIRDEAGKIYAHATATNMIIRR